MLDNKGAKWFKQMQDMKRDLENEEDIKLLVNTFYESVNQDELLSPVFNDFSRINWEKHLPLMYSFWSTVLLGSMAYKGQPFPKHMSLPIERRHFSRWVELFCKTTDTLFEGNKATEAKQKATSIAHVFQVRLGMSDILIKQPAL
ncbi:group III truncated hemoglobin [Pontibacter sp. H249]|uniref:group III truncated hemoglobin n=1 Tax=Pontibacter sp. H249 TaxID=3133420 RepID=UPI0030BBC08E